MSAPDLGRGARDWGCGSAAWADAALAAALFAIDPAGCRGVVLRARVGPVRERWLGLARGLLPPHAPMRQLPLNIGDDRLLGGLDLAATFRAGHPVAQTGLLAEADGGVVFISMAERLPAALAARLGAVLDQRAVILQRDGIEQRQSTVIGVIALDEGIEFDEQAPAALRDRLAFHVDLTGTRVGEAAGSSFSPSEIAAARRRLPRVRIGGEIVRGLCAAGHGLGIASVRAVLLAANAARAAAALTQRDEVGAADAAIAGRLVLAPRATVSPPEEADPPDPEPGEQLPPPDAVSPPRDDSGEAAPVSTDAARHHVKPDRVEDIVLAAARAAIPPLLLAQLRSAEARGRRPASVGHSSALHPAALRGRPAGMARGEPRPGSRLDLIATLRAAAPWQALRRRAGRVRASDCPRRIEIRCEDFRLIRFTRRTQTTVIFALDASGSSALHRLAETKGAVELLLAECYVRRDRVALVAFRGQRAELLLPPTRSLARARRNLAGLPGGGATPLAAGIEAAAALADGERRRGGSPVIVLLTDGRGNVARDGGRGHEPGGADALRAARAFRPGLQSALLIDTSVRPQPGARRLAAEMDAAYLPLPAAGSAAISQAVRAQVVSVRCEIRR